MVCLATLCHSWLFSPLGLCMYAGHFPGFVTINCMGRCGYRIETVIQVILHTHMYAVPIVGMKKCPCHRNYTCVYIINYSSMSEQFVKLYRMIC